ncbi:Co2+/Mg2+ efflux protein ApaG [Cloacibacterium sp.]|uniref:Co2+/Mg2+ efflux protein ApaG n=1 Tax=Cloacibacterium sp. TaxID=1913682 RepID=UPI0039E3C997
MYSAVSNGIKISVVPEYHIKNSFPAENRFVFRYNITIENLGIDAVKLLKRRWLIYDLGFGFTEVKGDGVIGLTPVIEPGETFKYFSNVILRSGVGNMLGNYVIHNLLTNETFEAEIPKFSLVSEVLSN